jgi:serine/threonine protein phosphatase PrpC
VTVASYARASDTGRKRRHNEDSYVVAPPLFAVADGMGGAQAGEVASKLAAAALEESEHGQHRGEAGVAALIQEANRRIYARSNADPSASGMGTTMTVALVEGDDVSIGHVGDSRAYLVRDGSLEQLTEDHSLVNELMKSGKLSPEEAETHPQRSVITRALGTDPDVDVDTFTVHARPGDLFVVCSDGLTSMVDDDEILGVLQRYRNDLGRATKALVQEANRGGGEDNITIVAFEISADDEDLSETIAMPVAEPAPEEEDTLSGIDSVPTLETVVLAPGAMAGLAAAGAEPVRVAELPIDREALVRSARIRLAVTMVLLFAVAVALVAWGLLR